MATAIATIRPRQSLLRGMLKQTDFWMAVGAISVVLMLITPLPTRLIDLLLTFNLALSLVVLLATAYLRNPLEFSVFPSLLLFAALFRVGLAVAVMRAILLNATAGQVVEAFGSLVLGGNYIVGVVLFLTLIVVQFVVVTGGANRIAEVVARFTLDALPGKQMSIDADMNAGLITEEQARARRRAIQQEADFYGAMDGASKFVRGDAVAALLITAINILAGVVIGLLQHQMDVLTALKTYALLTVGQGIVIQIPALLISSASGLIVTRAAAEENLSQDLFTQITSQPRALWAAAMGSALLGCVPGLPKVPFLVLAVVLGVAGRLLSRPRPSPDELAAEGKKAEPEDMTTYLPLDPLTLELGYALVPLAMESEGGDLLTRITNLRRQVALEMGIIVPPIRVKDDLTLTPNQYTLKLRGVGIALGEVLPHFFLAMNAGRATGPIEGAATTDPAFGLPAYWVSVNERDKAERAGYAIIDAPSVLITHLAEALKDHAHEILTRQEVRLLLDRVHETNPTIVDELIPELLSRGQVQRVLQNLVQERVPIRDLVSILEALADGVALTHDLDELTELARQRLARVICEALASQDRLPAVVLDPSLERLLAESIQPTSRGRVVVLNAERMQRFAENLSAQMEAVAGLGYQPVLVCTSQVRLPLRRLLARLLPRLVVLSYEEADRGQVQVNALGMVRLES